MAPKTSRRLILVAVAGLLLIAMGAVLFQFTEVDAPVTSAFRGLAPAGSEGRAAPAARPAGACVCA